MQFEESLYHDFNKRKGYNFNLDGYTFFIQCITSNYYDLVEKILKNGADIECKDYYGKTPLFWALTKNNNLNIVEILLKAGANPNIKIKNVNNIEYPLFIWVICYNDYTFNIKFNLLLKYGLLLNEYSKYKEIIIYYKRVKESNFYSILAKRRWVYLKTVVKCLSLHKRAVVTANHPDRLLEQGYFQLEI